MIFSSALRTSAICFSQKLFRVYQLDSKKIRIKLMYLIHAYVRRDHHSMQGARQRVCPRLWEGLSYGTAFSDRVV